MRLSLLSLGLLLMHSLAPMHLCAAQQKEERAIDPQHPLQVDLLAPLDVTKLKPEDRIFAKSRIEWRSDSCSMRVGSAISGHVIEVERRGKDKTASKLTILFDTAICDGQLSHIPFSLFAIIVDPRIHDGVGMADYGTFGASSNKPHFGLGGGGGASSAATPMDRSQDMAIQNAGIPLKLPSVIQAGDVFGMKNLALSVGTGPGGSSTISSTKSNVRLETGTQFVLMPKRIFAPQAATAAAVAASPAAGLAKAGSNTVVASQPAEIPAPHEVEPDETQVCTSPCSVVSSAGESSTQANAAAEFTLSATDFGYGPRESGKYAELTRQATLSFLDGDNLLFTFDSRALRHRYSDGIRTESARTVRAVLIDASSHEVKQVRDWRIDGEGQYVWPASDGRVLVHLSHTLYLMNSHLQPIRSVPVPGHLVFVSLSPKGDRIAVGTLHERHTADMHEQLRDANHGEPEEDVDVQLFDDHFKPLLTFYQSTSFPLPSLTESGELYLQSTGRNQWKIGEYEWDKTDHAITTIRSVCRPEISTPSSDLLFVVGCNSSPLQNWYRMMRTDGHSVLFDRGSSREIQQAALSTDDRQFAVRVVRTGGSKANGDFFVKSDLLTQEISVYRAADGRRTFKTEASPSLCFQSFALSPTGERLAILSGGKIAIYTIPAPR